MEGAENQPRGDLEGLQCDKLAELIGEILPHNRFYERKFTAAGLSSKDFRRLEDLEKLPFTTKEDLQEDHARHPPYGTNLTYPVERYSRLHQTSGTTGQPIRWLDTPASWQAMLDCWQIIYDAAGITPADRFFFPFSFGPFIGFWAAFDGAVQRGNLCIPSGGLSTIARLRWILDHDVTIIACTPTYALRLGEVAAEEGLDLVSSSLRALIVAGEPGGAIHEVRQRIETLWGARCFDHWGMTEVGPLAFEPLDRPGGMHLIESNCIAEIIDPDSGTPLRTPGTGELIITTLERRGSPLLRYRTGDLVQWSEGSAPGDSCHLSAAEVDPHTGWPWKRLEGGVLGRRDQMVLVRGNNVYPGAVESVVRQFSEVREYQAEILKSASGNQLLIKLELVEACESTAERFRQRFVRAFQDRFFFRPDVAVVAKGSLPRFELKARRFIIKEVDTS